MRIGLAIPARAQPLPLYPATYPKKSALGAADSTWASLRSRENPRGNFGRNRLRFPLLSTLRTSRWILATTLRPLSLSLLPRYLHSRSWMSALGVTRARATLTARSGNVHDRSVARARGLRARAPPTTEGMTALMVAVAAVAATAIYGVV